MAPRTISASKTERFLIGKTWNTETFDRAVEVLRDEVILKGEVPGGKPEYRTALSLSFFYKFFISVLKQIEPSKVSPELQSATTKLYMVIKKKKNNMFSIPYIEKNTLNIFFNVFF